LLISVVLIQFFIQYFCNCSGNHCYPFSLICRFYFIHLTDKISIYILCILSQKVILYNKEQSRRNWIWNRFEIWLFFEKTNKKYQFVEFVFFTLVLCMWPFTSNLIVFLWTFPRGIQKCPTLIPSHHLSHSKVTLPNSVYACV